MRPSPFTRRRLLQLLGMAPGAFPAALSARASAAVDWKDLSRLLPGRLTIRGTAEYDAIYNVRTWSDRKPHRYPGAIVRGRSVADVQQAVRFARKQGLRVAIRGGGHNYFGTSLRDGGMLIDLSGFKDVRIDGAQRKAAAGPGVLGRDLLAHLAPHGLAFPTGHCSDVPLSGFLLNGGFGWNLAWGPACNSVESIEVVVASGEHLMVNERQNPDLFWAARGGGSGFPGVVTRYHLKLFALPRSICTTTLAFSLEDMPAAFRWLEGAVANLPQHLDMLCTAPATEELARSIGAPGKRLLVFIATVFADSKAAARQLLSPLEASVLGPKPLIRDLCRETPFDALYVLEDAAFPSGNRVSADMMWCQASPTQLLPLLRELIHRAPGSRSNVMINWNPPMPAQAPVSPDVALSMFGESYVGIYGYCADESEDAGLDAWVKSVHSALLPHRIGGYIGETNLSATPGGPSSCFTPPAWERLQAIKRKYDPDNLFFSYLTPA